MSMAASDVAAGALGSAVGEKASNPAVRLAVAILLFWLAGLMFFIAFGSGGSYLERWSGLGGGLGALRDAFGKMVGQGGKDVAGAASPAGAKFYAPSPNPGGAGAGG